MSASDNSLIQQQYIQMKIKVNYVKSRCHIRDVYDALTVPFLNNKYIYIYPDIQDEQGTGDTYDGSFFSFKININISRIDNKKLIQNFKSILHDNNCLPKYGKERPIQIMKQKPIQNLRGDEIINDSTANNNAQPVESIQQRPVQSLGEHQIGNNGVPQCRFLSFNDIAEAQSQQQQVQQQENNNNPDQIYQQQASISNSMDVGQQPNQNQFNSLQQFQNQEQIPSRQLSEDSNRQASNDQNQNESVINQIDSSNRFFSNASTDVSAKDCIKRLETLEQNTLCTNMQMAKNFEDSMKKLENNNLTQFANLKNEIGQQCNLFLEMKKENNTIAQSIERVDLNHTERINYLQKEIGELNTSIQIQQQEKSRIEKQISQINDDCIQQFSQLSKEINKHNILFNESRQENTQLEDLIANSAQNKSEISSLKEEITCQNSLIQEIKEQNNALSSAKTKIESSQSENYILITNEISQQNALIKDIKNENEGQNSLINKLENQQTQMMSKLENEMSDQKRQIIDLKKENTSLNTQLTELQMSSQQQKNFQQKQEERAKRQEEQIEKLTLQVSELKQQTDEKVAQMLVLVQQLNKESQKNNDSVMLSTQEELNSSLIVNQNRNLKKLSTQEQSNTVEIKEIISGFKDSINLVKEYSLSKVPRKVKTIVHYLWLPNLVRGAASSLKNSLYSILPQSLQNNISNEYTHLDLEDD